MTMGKKKEPPTPVTLVSSKDPPGMKLDFSELTSWKYWLVIALALILIGVAAHQIFGNHGPQYRPARDLSPLLEVGTLILQIIGAILVLAALLGTVAFVLHIHVQHKKGLAEAKKSAMEAELIQPTDTGQFPWRRAPDGSLQNLNAMPSATIAPDGTPKEPDTEAQKRAVERASLVQLAAAARGRFLPGTMPPPRSGPEDLPQIRVIDGEVASHVERLLLETGEE